MLVLKENHLDNWFDRLRTLKDTIDYWIKSKTDKTIETIQLFYD